MKPVGQRVREWREAQGLSVSQLAAMVGTSRQNIENLEKGFTERPRFLPELARVMGRSVEDLVATKPHSARARHDGSNVAPDAPTTRVVPLINRAPAGDWQVLVDSLTPGDVVRMIETTADVGPHGFAVTVTGHSMISPTGPHSFPPGTVLFVNPDLEPKVGHFVIVRHRGDTEFIFRRLARDAGQWVLEPLNPRYDVMKMPADAHICGVVVKAEISTL